MNPNRLQANKENYQSLQNARPAKDPARPALTKEVNPKQSIFPWTDLPTFTESCPTPILLSLPLAPASLPPVDLPNPQEVVEFQDAIMSYLRARDAASQVDPFYMNQQLDITPKMRSILVDWLVDVHIKFKLLPQTIFMTVNLIDRFLAVFQTTRQQLQLVGITCLMIICKFEEIYPPLLKDYVAVCDNAYTRDQILEMESTVIQTLNFDVSRISCLAFLDQLQLRAQLEPRALIFARYILENSLFDLNSLRHSNLTLVAGSIFLVNKIFKRGNWKASFEALTGVPEVTAKACAKDLFSTMQKMETVNLTALKRKFSTPENLEVARYRIEKARN